jgi:hypothetical protein
VISLFLLFIARATSRQGSRDTYDWDDDFDDDYEDEHDEAFDDEDEDEASLAPAAATAAAEAEPVKAEAASDGWTQGADGVWWYHDPNDGSWWYRGADGVDRRHG